MRFDLKQTRASSLVAEGPPWSGSQAAFRHLWKLPPGTIVDKPGYHAVLQNRMLKDGKLNCY